MSVLISVFDKKASRYWMPMSFETMAHVSRAFQSIDDRAGQSQVLYRFPEDFDLYQVGQFEEITGTLEAFDQPQFYDHMSAFVLRKDVNRG